MSNFDLKQLHAALAGIVRDQARFVASGDHVISTSEADALIETPIKDIVERVRKTASQVTVDAVVGTVLKQKKSLLGAAGVTGTTIGYQELFALEKMDSALGKLMRRAARSLVLPEFDLLAASAKDREEALADGVDEVKNAQWTEIDGEPNDPALKAYVKTVRKEVSALLPDNEAYNDGGTVMIGSPKVQVSVLRSLTGEILGATASAFQAGGAYRDETDGSYEPEDDAPPREYVFATVAQAKAAGVDTDADVSWACSGFNFGHDGKCLNEDGGQIWEWTGW